MLRKIFIVVSSTLFMGVLGLFTVHAQAQPNSCDRVNNQESLPVFFVPMYSWRQLKDILPQNAAYTIIAENEGNMWIEYGSGERGWIDFHARIMNGDCQGVPQLHLPLTDFPTICFYNIAEEIDSYRMPDFSNEPDGHIGPGTYPISGELDNGFQLAGSSAMSGPSVKANHGTLSGHCDGTLRLASALDNARVWTEPNAAIGQTLGVLEAGFEVGIVEGPVQGRLQTDSDVQGNWYKVQRGEMVGWVWEDRLRMGRTYTIPLPLVHWAAVLDGARVWTQPDVTTGQIVTTLMSGGDYIKITGEAVEGVIRAEPVLQGMWYPVQLGGTTGWVSAERLSLLGD
jgi:hypothetical protein